MAPSDPAGRKAPDWFLYEDAVEQIGEEEVEQDAPPVPQKQKVMKGRDVQTGSFDPKTCSFSKVRNRKHKVPVTAAPARNTCLVCGSTAGSGSILTPVELGTSAAVRVLSEALVEVLYEQNGAAARDDKKTASPGLCRQPPGRRPPGTVHDVRGAITTGCAADSSPSCATPRSPWVFKRSSGS